MSNSNSESESKSIDWTELSASKKEAKGIDDYDLGEVQVIGTSYVVTQKGSINRQRFYIPKYLVEGYDWDVVRFKVTKEDAENKFVKPPSEDEYSKYETPEVATDIETHIPVIAERLEVSKKEVTMEATLIKEPVRETKTVDVPLLHEELVIERRPAGEFKTTNEQLIETKTEINIPLKSEEKLLEEQINVIRSRLDLVKRI